MPDAAKELGVSRQYAHKLAADGYFKSLHRLGESTFVINSAELASKKLERKERAERES